MNIITEGKIIVFLLGLFVMIFIMANRGPIKNAYRPSILIAALFAILSSWLFAMLETFLFYDFFNFLEHLAYLISALLLFFWVFKLQKDRVAK